MLPKASRRNSLAFRARRTFGVPRFPSWIMRMRLAAPPLNVSEDRLTPRPCSTAGSMKEENKGDTN